MSGDSPATLLHRVAAARTLFLIDPLQKAAAVAHIVALDGINGVCLDSCVKVHQLLAGDFGDAAAAESYKAACKPLFPISTYFGTGAPRPPAEEAKTEAEVPDVPGQADGKKKK